ncbi:hypothetical protein GIB67_011501 [Kingdonia uniflora]|uniref:Reverse transcriptase zinc-binding domain-containing protein n=1 Tax=Kingdonia uniflora TaxID=39325 RepID=A0A7J7NLV9_9MAGN|nr:hypothetical protein GIB67_011501 [Kingdonia uniflora]
MPKKQTQGEQLKTVEESTKLLMESNKELAESNKMMSKQLETMLAKLHTKAMFDYRSEVAGLGALQSENWGGGDTANEANVAISEEEQSSQSSDGGDITKYHASDRNSVATSSFDGQDISSYIVQFYEDKFKAVEKVTPNPDLTELIPSTVGDDENNMLCSIPSADEVKQAVFHLSSQIAHLVQMAFKGSSIMLTGDPNKRKAVTVSWEKRCKPQNEGGLGLKKLGDINKSMLMKHAWGIVSKEGMWASYMKSKFFTRQGDMIKYYKKSTMWSGIKTVYSDVVTDSIWLLGSGNKADTWKDNWTGEGPIMDTPGLTRISWKDMHFSVSDLLIDGAWAPNQDTKQILDAAGVNLTNVFVNNAGDDTCPCKHDVQGTFRVKTAHEAIRAKLPICWWYKYLSKRSSIPKLSNLAWRILHNAVPTDSTIQTNSINLASQCKAYKLASSHSSHIEDLWVTGALAIISSIWGLRNKVAHDVSAPSLAAIYKYTLTAIQESSLKSTGVMKNLQVELNILHKLQVSHKRRRAPRIRSCIWELPWYEEVKINCDGSPLGIQDWLVLELF